MIETITAMPRLHRLILFGLLCTFGRPASATEAPTKPLTPAPYELGQGLLFPDIGLDVGGYASLQYESLSHRTPAFNAHDLSLFLTEHIDARWSLFAELEMEDALLFSEEGDVSHDPELDVERLYLDYRVSPAITLRIGKFLTPVGSWNMIHADPLVWTVSRPLTATAAFPRHATGAMVYGSVPSDGHDLDYWVFVDDTARLDPLEQDEKAFEIPGSSVDLTSSFDRAFGGRVLYHFIDDRLRLGASYVYFEKQRSQPGKNLVGLDLACTTRYVQLSGEAVYRAARGWSQPDERGGFLQAVIPLPAHFYLVGRYERYSATVLSTRPTIDTFGITYRPRPPLSVKLEYRSGSHNDRVAPDGWLASLAILF